MTHVQFLTEKNLVVTGNEIADKAVAISQGWVEVNPVTLGDKRTTQTTRIVCFDKEGVQKGTILDANKVNSTPKGEKLPLEGREIIVQLENGTEKTVTIFDGNQFPILQSKLDSQQLGITLTYKKRTDSVYMDLTIS